MDILDYLLILGIISVIIYLNRKRVNLPSFTKMLGSKKNTQVNTQQIVTTNPATQTVTHAHGNTQTTTTSNKWDFWSFFWPGVAIVVSIFLIIVLWNAGSTFVRWCKTPTVQKTCTVQQNSGKQKTLYIYKFSDFQNGIIYVTLRSNYIWYPKGGKIKIKTSSGKIWDDEPGKQYDRPQEPPGTFSFWANPEYPGASGVEIWQ